MPQAQAGPESLVGMYVDYVMPTGGAQVRLVQGFEDNTAKIHVIDPVQGKWKGSDYVTVARLRPFRSETQGRGGVQSTAGYNNYYSQFTNKHLDLSLLTQYGKVLESYQFGDLCSLPQFIDILQFLSGKHYFYMLQLTTYMPQNMVVASQIRAYFQSHLEFMSRYIAAVKFSSVVMPDLYAYSSRKETDDLQKIQRENKKKMDALCKCWFQMVEITMWIISITAERSAGKGLSDEIKQTWAENQMLPNLTVLMDAKNIKPIRVLLSILELLALLHRKKLLWSSDPVRSIVTDIYTQLLGKIRLHLVQKKEIEWLYINESDGIYSLMEVRQIDWKKIYHKQEKVLQIEDKSIQKLDPIQQEHIQMKQNAMDIEPSSVSHLNIQIELPQKRQPISKNKSYPKFKWTTIQQGVQHLQTLKSQFALVHSPTSEQILSFMKFQKIFLRMIVLSKIHPREFVQQMNSFLTIITRDYDTSKQDLPVQAMIHMINNQELFSKVMAVQTFNEILRQVIMRLFKFLPDQTIEMILLNEKIIYLKFLYSRMDQAHLNVVLEFLQRKLKQLQSDRMSEEDQDGNQKAVTKRHIYSEFYEVLLYFMKCFRPNLYPKNIKAKTYECLLECVKQLPFQQNKLEQCLITDDNYELTDKHVQCVILKKMANIMTHFQQVLLIEYLHRKFINQYQFVQLVQPVFQIDNHLKNITQIYQHGVELRRKSISIVLVKLFSQSSEDHQIFLSELITLYQAGHKEFQGKNLNRHLSLIVSNLILFPQWIPNIEDALNLFQKNVTQQFCQNNMKKLLPLQGMQAVELYAPMMWRMFECKGASQDQESKTLMLPGIQQVYKAVAKSIALENFAYAKQLILTVIEKYMVRVGPAVYSQMLLHYLMFMVEKNPGASLFYQSFIRLKVKFPSYQPKDQDKAGSIIKILIRNQDMMCKVTKKYKVNFNQFQSYLHEDQIQKCYHTVEIKNTQLMDAARQKIASYYSKQPKSVLLSCAEYKVTEDDLSLRVDDFFKKMESIEKIEESKQKSQWEVFKSPSFIVNFQENRTPIQSYILLHASSIFDSMYAINLMKGIKIQESEWQKESLKTVAKYLQQPQHTFQYIKNKVVSPIFVNIILDYYTSHFDEKRDYSFLLGCLVRPSKQDQIKRNIKIFLLLYKSVHRRLNMQEISDILNYLYPINKEKDLRDKDITKLPSYIMFSKLFYTFLQEIEAPMLDLCFDQKIGGKMIDNSSSFPTIWKNFLQFWRKIYSKMSLNQKIQFYRTIELKIINSPNIWRCYSYLIAGILFKQEEGQFYNNLADRLAKLFTIKQLSLNSFCVALRMISGLLKNGRECKALKEEEVRYQIYSKMFCVYSDYLVDYNDLILEIAKDQTARRNICQLLISEISEKEWETAPHLTRPPLKRHQQQKYLGLRNPHSICYVNSLLQQLFHIQKFRKHLYDTEWKQNDQIEQDLIYQLKKTFMHLQSDRQAYLNPEFFNAFKNSEGNKTSWFVQMDVDQFRNLLFDRIESLLHFNQTLDQNGQKKSKTNFLTQLFNGQLSTVIKSMECTHQSQKKQDFSSICLEVKDHIKMQESVQGYFKEEMLQGENAYMCDECQKKVKASKSIRINKYPQYLFIVLKRFEFKEYFRSKVNSYLQFPLNTWSPAPGINFKLIGIIIHQGSSENGHYISLHNINGVWWQFNDSTVHSVNQSYLAEMTFGGNQSHWGKGFNCVNLNKNAYLLLYEKIEDTTHLNTEASSNAKIEKGNQNQNQMDIETKQQFYPVGMQAQIKKMKIDKILLEKSQYLFDPSVLYMVTQLSEKYKDECTSNLLLKSLITIHFKLPLEMNQSPSINFPLKYLWKNSKIFHNLWTSSLLHYCLEFIVNSPNPRFKSVVTQLMIDDYIVGSTNGIEVALKCMQKIYDDRSENFQYYMLLDGLARIDIEILKLLSQGRMIGRIIDITLAGIFGQKIRQELKKSTKIPFQTVSFSTIKQTKIHRFYSYHKWKLLLFLMNNPAFKISDLEKKYLLLPTSAPIFNAIFEQCSTKVNTNYVAKFFSLMSIENFQYFKQLQTYLHDSMIKYTGDDLRKYLRTWKELLIQRIPKESDPNYEQRLKKGVLTLGYVLNRVINDRYEVSTDIVWQWILKIAAKNSVFRNKIQSSPSVFQKMQKLTINFFINKHLSLKILTQAKYKSKYSGVRFPATKSQLPIYFQRKMALTKKILHDPQFVLQPKQQQGYDSDSDLTDDFDHAAVMRFDENANKFKPGAIEALIGDLVLIKMDGNSEQMIDFCERGHDQLTQWFEYPDENVESGTNSEMDDDYESN